MMPGYRMALFAALVTVLAPAAAQLAPLAQAPGWGTVQRVAAPAAASASAFCRVQAVATPNGLPGMFTVLVTVKPDTCGPAGTAQVRLDTGALTPWRTVPQAGLRYTGVPWWARVDWRGWNGKPWAVSVANLRRPW